MVYDPCRHAHPVSRSANFDCYLIHAHGPGASIDPAIRTFYSGLATRMLGIISIDYAYVYFSLARFECGFFSIKLRMWVLPARERGSNSMRRRSPSSRRYAHSRIGFSESANDDTNHDSKQHQLRSLHQKLKILNHQAAYGPPNQAFVFC
jgi:hypothetical protein